MRIRQLSNHEGEKQKKSPWGLLKPIETEASNIGESKKSRERKSKKKKLWIQNNAKRQI